MVFVVFSVSDTISGLYTRQEFSYLGKIYIVSISNGCHNFDTLVMDISIQQILQFWYPWVGSFDTIIDVNLLVKYETKLWFAPYPWSE